jgi:hypothetical protein
MSDREQTKPAIADGETPPACEGARLPVPAGRGRPPVEHRFKAGNPGRPRGSRNKLSEQFIAALCADFEEHGVKVIARVRKKDPATYLRVIARLVPQSVLLHNDSGGLHELSDDELAAYLFAVREALNVRVGAG